MITAEVIADSINYVGDRLTTLRLHYPRFIHCFDEETEILTQIGDELPKFRHFKAVKELQCKVAQFNSDSDEIEFVYPTNYIENYSTNHEMVSIDRRSFNMCVTKEHRVFTKKRTTNNKYINDTILAKDLLGSYVGSRRIIKSGNINVNQYLSNDEISLIMFYVADGHKPVKGAKVQFHFRKQRKIQRVCALLESLNIKYVLKMYNEDAVIKFSPPWWVDKCYNDKKEKILPDILFYMNNEGYKHFKQAALESDDSVSNHDYNTFSKELAEQIQVIAHLHNDAMNIRKYDGLYKQKFSKANYISFSKDKDSFIETSYKGNVYCVTVPSSYVMVRRKGIVFISGNCEMLRHRIFSHSVSSSRAIPVQKMIEQVEENPALPIYWGKNKAGMSADEEVVFPEGINPNDLWRKHARQACINANGLYSLGVHKQITNRLLEPFQYVNQVLTGTDFDNFFYLRIHKDAQPEIQELAIQIKRAIDKSKPKKCRVEWHLPYITDEMRDEYTREQCIKISVSVCAQASYRKEDLTIETANRIYDKLITSKPIHACYDKDTELLTENGWVKCYEYAGQKIAAFNSNNHEITFEEPSQYNIYDYDGDLIYTKGPQIDLLTTPNHRQFVSRRVNEGWLPYDIETSEQIFDKTRKYLKAGNYSTAKGMYSPIDCKLLGFYIGDGSENYNKVNFHLKKPRKIAFLNIFDDVKMKAGNIYQLSHQCGKWLTANCRTKNEEKKLPDDFIHMTKRQWEDLKTGLFNSDGSKKRKTWTYCSSSKTLINQVQILAHLHGETCSISKKHRGAWVINFSNNITPECSPHLNCRSKGSSNRYVPYKGKVYCPTISTGLILVRRNKKVVISGNSPAEHIAKPFSEEEYMSRIAHKNNFKRMLMATGNFTEEQCEEKSKLFLYEGNFKGWSQYRKSIPGETFYEK